MPAVLVLGASGGIGAAICRRFAEDGYAVALHYCSGAEKARQLTEELRAGGCDAEAFAADLSDPTAAEALIAAAEARFGHIDCLVCAQGIARRELVVDTTPESWRQLTDINLGASVFAAKAVCRGMIRRGRGSILFVSSMWGTAGASLEAVYSATKAGLHGLTYSLAKELAPSGIRVNCVAPGVIDTPMNGDLSAEDMAALAADTPLGRIGTPEDVAEAAAFLCSERASFITGQVLGVDGGFIL
ncbi:MAG: SDR family oxidoreductase [Clostridia bacterium]|nr:SDR family oxidoreductase [Clostridia bacterium]